ncbi:MAG: ECF transporter S component [Chloroflexi bacterium]|nr:ECF transporter S component [Chloroflexota bacterium]
MALRSALKRDYYFTTRDLLLMAVLAGLGGVASTAINALGDAVQAVLGFAGTTQWAAGLHVTLLVLVVGLTRKSGAATVAGLLKGAVEVLSGNTHGIIVLLVDVAAGLLIDLVFLLVRRKDALWTYLLAGALAAASNVVIFQLFVSAPEDVLVFVWGISALAAVSGAVLGGLLAHTLLGVLRRNGLAPAGPVVTMGRWRQPAFLAFFFLAVVAGGIYLRGALAGPPAVLVTGSVAAPYEYSAETPGLASLDLMLSLQGMTRRASGPLLRDVLALAQPDAHYGAVLVTATDGYSFFIGRDEVEQNTELLLAGRGEGREMSFEIAGARNSKAWVRNVSELRVVAMALVEVEGQVARPFPYNPEEWQFEMDNATLDLGTGPAKYQGVVLADLLARWEPSAAAAEVAVRARNGETAALPLAEVLADRSLRIWTVSTPEGMRFAVAYEDGRVVARDVVALEVR